MANQFDEFVKTKDYLICVDSDGCAMDTMNVKHFKCFGPCIVDIWELHAWKEDILRRWNEVNLYTMTRGINRFKGLALALCEVNEIYTKIEGVKELESWVNESKELSNEALRKAYEESGYEILKKALDWSNAVNEGIQKLADEEKVPFEGVEAGLVLAHEIADVAIVSSANRQAVVEEWEMYHLLGHTDIVLSQTDGSKAYCISELKKKGYDPDKILMVGDAPGDLDAAKSNEVLYYPILVNKEKESWDEFREVVAGHFIEGSYAGAYQEEKINDFVNNLSGK